MNQKLGSHSNKYLIKNNKCYMQIDFAFIILIFFTFFYIIYINFDSKYELLLDQAEFEELNLDSNYLCNLLIKSSGSPSDWNLDFQNNINLGLKNESSYSLDSNKIASFSSQNYFNLSDSLGLGYKYFNLNIIGLSTNTSYLNIGYPKGDTSFFGNYVCYSNYNSEIVKVTVEVWK